MRWFLWKKSKKKCHLTLNNQSNYTNNTAISFLDDFVTTNNTTNHTTTSTTHNAITVIHTTTIITTTHTSTNITTTACNNTIQQLCIKIGIFQ